MSHFSVASLIQLGFSYTLTPTLAFYLQKCTYTAINAKTQVKDKCIVNVDPPPPHACLLSAHNQQTEAGKCCSTREEIGAIQY